MRSWYYERNELDHLDTVTFNNDHVLQCFNIADAGGQANSHKCQNIINMS